MHFQSISVMKLTESVFYLLYGVESVLSLFLGNSKLHVERDDTTDTPRGLLYINISVKDVLYINDWRGCLLFSLSSTRVLLASRMDNGATASTPFLYPAGLFHNLQHILTNPRPSAYRNRRCLLY